MRLLLNDGSPSQLVELFILPLPPKDPLYLKFTLQLYYLFPDLLSQIRKELILFYSKQNLMHNIVKVRRQHFLGFFQAGRRVLSNFQLIISISIQTICSSFLNFLVCLGLIGGESPHRQISLFMQQTKLNCDFYLILYPKNIVFGDFKIFDIALQAIQTDYFSIKWPCEPALINLHIFPDVVLEKAERIDLNIKSKKMMFLNKHENYRTSSFSEPKSCKTVAFSKS